MVDRPNKPTALVKTPGLPPQPQVTISQDNTRVTASLHTGESIEVLLYGATVLSWKDCAGDEKLWLSETAKLDGSKPVRGGIPIVFPLFGPPNASHAATSSLPQHGFARNVRWEFLGKSTSEGSSSNVKLDFGLSSEGIDEATRSLWPYSFGLLYSVTLDRESLNTTLVITNDGNEPFEIQTLFHTYFRVQDIASVQVGGLEDASYTDRVGGTKTEAGTSSPLTIAGETDRVYQLTKDSKKAIVISDGGEPRFNIFRDNLDQAVVWNPWDAKSAAMADFSPKDGFKRMICVEAGSVQGWQKLDKGDAFEGAQTIFLP
ncbi:Aldose 1-epimerase family protein [Drechmeria coniospora]|uniref:Glucose-6-phosphate 1-epimerase n=1 Tax=Drechmeria coniospora TaxID=98403 RepID=A0A151GBS4_DRECN|nr:Aldose 1-epimerase family protein [Drechmeria coniospora]KYK54558.1 Aldose 1-epimerase family protein [Drechmeria coniospora]